MKIYWKIYTKFPCCIIEEGDGNPKYWRERFRFSDIYIYIYPSLQTKLSKAAVQGGGRNFRTGVVSKGRGFLSKSIIDLVLSFLRWASFPRDFLGEGGVKKGGFLVTFRNMTRMIGLLATIYIHVCDSRLGLLYIFAKMYLCFSYIRPRFQKERFGRRSLSCALFFPDIHISNRK